ncbi:hypothetical protein ACFO1B_36325 [Dactylosporangium siamense]|uniref:Uncharacterized protein n=1 Tax=Dactylosporangium siamense TaxID=685454 RepID=A0A919UBW8_9ACTN|nr:hypothetical protein [Dactylosporangium siamense]GIG46045.1 hypothetical protein Dsi01nite_040860 [Dactylosporangium siamense]
MDSWVPFRRSDTAKVVDLVRAVADARDPGEHGEGVEVIVEAPPERRRWWRALFQRDGTRPQARIVVTRDGGAVRHPFDIQLVTAHGADAAHRLGRRTGWAVSNSNGLAFLIHKGPDPDFGELVTGAVEALAKLRRQPRDGGWRARVDRGVTRR